MAAGYRLPACPRVTQSSLINRSLIYTAITRAQREIVICGNYASLAKAVQQK